MYGLDLGSYDIKVYDKKKDTIWKEKTIAFKDNRDRDILQLEMMHSVCMEKHHPI